MSNKPPYYSGNANYDKTERISTLEIEQRHTNKVLEQHSVDLRSLGSKVDRLSSTLDRVETQLPFFINELKEVVESFQEFKQHNINQQIATLRDEQEKKIKNVEQTVETGSKMKIIWGMLGAAAIAILTIVVKIISTRFGI